jgi:MFS family permease
VAQGAAAAVMTPQLLATFRTIFSAKERGQAFGLYGAVLGFASAIGLILGGILTGANLFGWSWRSVFFVNIPIALVSLVLAARSVPETRERSARRPDLAGAALLTAALVAIVYPLLEGRTRASSARIRLHYGSAAPSRLAEHGLRGLRKAQIKSSGAGPSAPAGAAGKPRTRRSMPRSPRSASLPRRPSGC